MRCKTPHTFEKLPINEENREHVPGFVLSSESNNKQVRPVNTLIQAVGTTNPSLIKIESVMLLSKGVKSRRKQSKYSKRHENILAHIITHM